MIKKTLLKLALAIPFFLLCQVDVKAADAAAEFRNAESMLLGVSIRGDLPGIQMAMNRIEPFLAKPAYRARANYLMGLGQWQTIYNGFGGDIDVASLGKAGYQHCAKAIEADPNLLDAYVVALQCLFRVLNADPDSQQWGVPIIQKLFADAKVKNPEHPGIQGQYAMVLIYSYQDLAGGYQKLQEVVATYEKSANGANIHQRWWHALTNSWLGWQALSQAQPQVEVSQIAFQRALALRPDFEWVREAMLQTTESLLMCTATSVQHLTWKPLVEDPGGDGQVKESADVIGLAYAHDRQEDQHWFRFQLQKPPNEAGFGINLVIDSDQDPKNGVKWWGGTNDFRFDHLVTAWVVKGKNGEYTGTMGIATGEAAITGQFTQLKRNNLTLSIDVQEKTILVGIPSQDLPFKGPIRILGAVGSNTQWNDNIPNNKGLLLQLQGSP